MTLPATAEVEEVTVGGSIQVRGNFQEPGLDSVTIPVLGIFNQSFDSVIPSDANHSQRTRVNADAALSGDVRAFVEPQAYEIGRAHA